MSSHAAFVAPRSDANENLTSGAFYSYNNLKPPPVPDHHGYAMLYRQRSTDKTSHVTDVTTLSVA